MPFIWLLRSWWIRTFLYAPITTFFKLLKRKGSELMIQCQGIYQIIGQGKILLPESSIENDLSHTRL